jgi:hypothetical protein
MGHNTIDEELATLALRMKEFIICSIGGLLAHLVDVLHHQVCFHFSFTLCFHFSVTVP